MELKVIEEKPKKLKLEVAGETHTFLNVITEYSWLAKASHASYIIQHPYLSQPELIIGSANPKNTLKNASQILIDKATEFQHAFSRATRK